MSYKSLSAYLDSIVVSKSNHSLVAEYYDNFERFAFQNGFDKEQLDEMWRKMLGAQMAPKIIVATIHWMVPADEVLPSTIDFVFGWTFSANNVNKKLVIKTVLQWLIALLQCKVVESRSMHHCYYMLLIMLTTFEFIDEVCHLLYLLSVPELITPYSVTRVLALKGIYKKQDSYAALVSLYKRLKPHLVDDYRLLGLTNDLELFPAIPRKLLLCFRMASDKLGYKPNAKLYRYPHWKNDTIAFKRRKLGNVLYISELTVPEAICECKRSEIYFRGTIFDSYLENPCGFIYLALSDGQFHSLFNEYIEKELERSAALLNRKGNHRFGRFLINLNNLQNSYGQGIFVVDQFLKENFIKWKGTAYIQEVFALLQHIVISDYEDTFYKILKPLYSLNLQFRDVRFARYTLKSLAWCLYNNENYVRHKHIFMEQGQALPTLANLKQFDKSFKHLCNLFVNTFQNNAEILHEIGDIHILLSTIETCSSIQSLLPLGIAHTILINSDFILIDKICRILIMNINQVKPDKKQSHDLSLQLEDFSHILLKNILRSTIRTKTLDCRWIDTKIGQIPHIKNNFKARNNLNFISLTRFYSDGKYTSKFDKTEFIRNLDASCKNFAILLKIK